MKTLQLLMMASTVCATLISPATQAERYNRDNDTRHTDYARVVSAEPVYRTVENRVPVESCWTEQVREEVPVYQQASYTRPKSATGVILGSVIGGAIGNAVGAGDENKKVGTVVGALLGASIGHDVSRKNRHRSSEQYSHTEVNYRDVQRCEMTDKIEMERVAIGYNVTYRYHGQNYTTHMDRNPGEKLKVAVHIQPIQ